MQTPRLRPQHRRIPALLPLGRLAIGVLALALLNGCAALAVSLAGAGAGAGLAHQMNGTASRTFSAPFGKVDAAVRLASKRMYLEVDEVASTEGGQVTRARVSNMNVSVALEPLSPNLTRVNVVARKDLFRVDGATAQEIVVQIERSLAAVELAESGETSAAQKGGKIDTTRFLVDEPPNVRKNRAPARKKTAI